MKNPALVTCLALSAAVVSGFSPLRAADPAAPAPPRQEGKGGKHFKPDGDRKAGPFHRRGGEQGHGHLGRMLDLTDDQKAKVQQIMDAARPKIEAIQAEERAKIKLIMDEAQRQIRPILTPEQQQVLDDAKKVREDMQKLRESRKKLRQDDRKTE